MIVHPTPPPSAPPTVVLYELRASHALPIVDCAKCLKDVLFASRLSRVNALLHKSRRGRVWGYALGSLLAYTFEFFPLGVSRWLAVGGFGLQLGPVLLGFLGLRFDMLRVLAGTYEVWYLTVVNALGMVAAAAFLGDHRALVPVIAAFGYQQMLLVDASYRGLQSMLVFAALGAVSLGILTVFALFRLFPATHEAEIFRYGPHRLTAVDVGVNALGTLLLMLVRNAYRRRVSIRMHRDHGGHQLTTATVRCITYRCRLKLHVVGSVDGHATRNSTRSRSDATDAAQLRFVQRKRQYASHHIVVRSLFHFIKGDHWSTSIRYIMLGSAPIGVAITAIGTTLSAQHPAFTMVSVAALLISALYCAVTVMLFQRRLARRLYSTFDYWFLSSQLTMAHLCLCHLLAWRPRCLAIGASWLWSHWVISLDALTPIVRRRFGIRPELAMAVVVLLIIGQVLLCVELVFLRHWDVPDRVLMTLSLGSRRVEVWAVPFLFSRLFTVFFWCCRLLWRLWRRACDEELLILQGTVEYDDPRVLRRLSQQRPGQVVRQLPHEIVVVSVPSTLSRRE